MSIEFSNENQSGLSNQPIPVNMDKGICGECRLFDPRRLIKIGSEEVWEGTCSNPSVPFSYTYSGCSPRQAFINAGAFEKLNRFLKEDNTCLESIQKVELKPPSKS